MEAVVKDSGEKIEHSAAYLGLYSGDWKKDPLPALQLGIAILLDKPIVIVVTDGSTVPESLKKVAVAIESASGVEDITRAVKKVMQAVRPH